MIILLKMLFVQIVYVKRFKNIHKNYDLYIKSLIIKRFSHINIISRKSMFPLIKISWDNKPFEEYSTLSLLTDSNNIIFLRGYKNENEHRKENCKDGRGKRRKTETMKKRDKEQIEEKMKQRGLIRPRITETLWARTVRLCKAVVEL